MSDEVANTEPVVAEPVISEPVVAEPVISEPVISEPVVAEPVVVETKPDVDIIDVDKDGIEDQTPEELAKYFGDFMHSIGDLFGNLAGGLKDVGDKLKPQKDERPEGDASIQDVFKRGGR